MTSSARDHQIEESRNKVKRVGFVVKAQSSLRNLRVRESSQVLHKLCYKPDDSVPLFRGQVRFLV